MLASASPRRRDLLAQAGVAFEVRPADIDESRCGNEPALPHARRLAREKALAVAKTLGTPGRLVLGADTIVVLDEAILGKPRDTEHAAALLFELTGRTHRVITAVAIARSDSLEIFEDAVESRVAMRTATAGEIRDYVAIGESLDKAGAYAVQGEGRRFIERIEGSESNVIGLPLDETLALLARARAGAPDPP